MEKFTLLLLFLLSSLISFLVIAEDANNLSEQWGYVKVRPKAMMFWWHYMSPHRVDDSSQPWPMILCLQGGPGSSGVAIGNFLEIGPLDGNLMPRNLTWLRKADLLFVDSPVGTGYSYVEGQDESLFVKTDEEAADDLITLLEELFNNNVALQKCPLHIFAESYGGKFAVTLGLAVLEAIDAGKLKLQLRGVSLGDSWISPQDFVFSWGPLLKDMSRIDDEGLREATSLALMIQQLLAYHKYADATSAWNFLEKVLLNRSNNVDFYNFMLDSKNDPVVATLESAKGITANTYSMYLSTKFFSKAPNTARPFDIGELMNGPIRHKLGIIPEGLEWGQQSGLVFKALSSDFMKPRIKEVDNLLLAARINVTIYNGQNDLICSTKGVEAWTKKLEWKSMKYYLNSKRVPLYCEDDKTTKAFRRSYRNLAFYWILQAGHFVPADEPCISLHMAGEITQSPSLY